jgi:hypothetical protein
MYHLASTSSSHEPRRSPISMYSLIPPKYFGGIFLYFSPWICIIREYPTSCDLPVLIWRDTVSISHHRVGFEWKNDPASSRNIPIWEIIYDRWNWDFFIKKMKSHRWWSTIGIVFGSKWVCSSYIVRQKSPIYIFGKMIQVLFSMIYLTAVIQWVLCGAFSWMALISYRVDFRSSIALSNRPSSIVLLMFSSLRLTNCSIVVYWIMLSR